MNYKNATKEVGAFIAAYLLLISIVFWWAVLIVVMSPIQAPVSLTCIFYPKLREWARHIITSQDQTVNALHGGNMDTHISGRVGYHSIRKNRIALHMERAINLLFYIIKGEVDHCKKAIEHDEIYHRHLGY